MTTSLSHPRLQLNRAPVPRGVQQLQRRLLTTAFAVPRPAQDAEGPGSGKRHYPDPAHQQFDLCRHTETEHHEMMSTEQCYQMFPLLTHSSTPLRIEDHEPAGLSAQRIGDAGPSTGRRRRPAPADHSIAAHRQLLPYPDTRATDLQRELMTRHVPEVLLAQQQLLKQHHPEA